ncbi:MAG: LysR substrate-binding domain-containing protein [Myxococcota bacterium]
MSRRLASLSLQLVCGDEMHNLSQREADIAVRATESPPPFLVGRRVGRLETGVYAHAAFTETSLEEIPWIGWSGLEETEGVVGRVRQEVGGRGAFVIHADSYGMVVELARHGAGATVLPRVLGDREPELVCLRGPIDAITLWVLTHPDLRHTPRIKKVMSETAELFKTFLPEPSARPEDSEDA